MSYLHLCYAAAGAGKTRALVRAYLLPILDDPTSIKETLAITFTNRSTYEMKERILRYLDQLAKGEESELLEEMAEALSCDTPTLQKRAWAARHFILHHYGSFAVVTIDHFFQHLVTLFRQALSLGDHSVLIDQQKMLEEILTTFWEGLENHPSLNKAIKNFIRYKVEEGKSWNISREMKALANVVLDRSIPSLLIRDRSQAEAEKIEALFQARATEASNFKKRVASLAKHQLALIDQTHFRVEDFAWGEYGILGALKKLAKHEVTPLSKRLERAAKEAKNWAAQKSPYREELIAFAKEQLQPHLQALVDTYRLHYRSYTTFRAIAPLHHALIAAPHLHKLLERYIAQHQELPIAHIPSLIAGLIDQMSIDLVYTYLGERPIFLLIDEFQDLSQKQWQVLRPLLSYALEQKGKAFLVGDVKQSIYRWRGGAPELFLTQVKEEMKEFPIEEGKLSYNWRSKPSIIYFNNAFFSTAPNKLASHLEERLAEEGEKSPIVKQKTDEIRNAYAHTVQHHPKRPIGQRGYVEVVLFPKNRDGIKQDWREEAIAYTIQKIEACQTSGYALSDIALLVRDHQEAATLLKALMDYAKSPKAKPGLRYDARTAGRATIDSSPYIQLLVQAMYYIQSPSDPWIGTTLLHLYQTYGGNKQCKDSNSTREEHEYWMEGKLDEHIQTLLPKELYEKSAMLLGMPIYALVTKLIVLLELKDPKILPFIRAFQEAVYDFAKGGGDLGTFLAWWEREGKRSPSTAPALQDHLQIMTIHQAKGLGFKVVLLPFCSWALDHPPHHPPILWCKSKETSFDMPSQVPLYYGKHLRETHYREQGIREQFDIYLEALNLLYVALTRAKERLYIGAPRGEGKISHTGHLLTEVCLKELSTANLPGWEVSEREERKVFSIGSEDDAEQKVPPKKESAASPIVVERTTTHSEAALSHIIYTPERAEGSWWHALLKEVKYREEVEEVVQAHINSGRLEQKEAGQLLKEIGEWWKDPLLRDWFSTKWEIKQEWSMILPGGTIVRPDRVMIRGRSAVVLDFKHGKKEPSHRKQVEHYTAILGEMGYSPVEGFLFYIKENQLVNCRSKEKLTTPQPR